MSLTKKHFKQLALAIAQSDNDFEQLVNNLISFCKSNNSRFNEKTFIDAIDNAQIKYDVDKEISNKIYISDEDKLMRDNNINWTQSEIIKK